MKALNEAVEAVVRALSFDEAEIARRKDFLEFTAEDVAQLRALHAVLQTPAPDFTNAFYDHLLAFEETHRFIPNAASLERLKRAQAEYFDSLTAGDYGPEYIAHRLRMGVVHQHIGLEPKWYLGAYNKYLGGLLPEIWQRLGKDPEAFINTYRALIKIVLLDMGLAIDTYIQADRQTILALKEYAEIVFANIPDGLLVLSPEFAILSVNRAFLKQFGLTAEAVRGRHLMEVIAAEGLKERALEVLATGVVQHDVPFSMGPAGSDECKSVRVTLTGIHLAEEEEEEARLLVIVEDVTEEEALRATALESEHRFRNLVQGLDAIVWEGEASGEGLRFTFVSRRAETILGLPVERWLAEPDFCKDRIHPDDRDAASGFCRRILEHDGGSLGEGVAWEVEFRMQAADGRMVWFHNLARRAADSRGARLHGVMMDITARKDLAVDLEHLASHDALTDLPNRTLLLDRLGQALTHAARHQRVAAVLFLDLDRFKIVNDSFDHNMGDQLLKAVAQRLSSCMRAGDTVARLGGDEFVIVLEDMAHAQDAALIVQKILEQFTQPFRVEGHEAGASEFYCTASIGISLYPGDGEDAHILLRNADAAMYRAKDHGGNRYHFFTLELNALAHRRLNLENALHRALEQEQFVLHYQPQVDRQTGKIIAVEALLRWNHPEQGLIAPLEFIPMLEETGLIVPVGEWVLHAACMQQRAWRDAGLSSLRVAVNLSVRQLRDGRFVDSVVRILADTGIEPSHLELEITESMVMQQVEEVIEMLRALSALGVGLAMDDFGTGYSSLSYLKRLPLSSIKIDQSFVGDITTDPDDAAIVTATIAMAHSLRLKVVAEGVETREQLDFLCERGCDIMQGYFFSKPLPAEEIPRLLQHAWNLNSAIPNPQLRTGHRHDNG